MTSSGSNPAWFRELGIPERPTGSGMDMASGKDRRIAPEPSGQIGQRFGYAGAYMQGLEVGRSPCRRTVRFRSLAIREIVYANTGGLDRTGSLYFMSAEPAPVAEGFLRFPLRKIKS